MRRIRTSGNLGTRASTSAASAGSREGDIDPARSCDGQPEYSEDGVDLTLIRWMLSLSPAERLQVLQDNIRSIQELRGESIET